MTFICYLIWLLLTEIWIILFWIIISLGLMPSSNNINHVLLSLIPLLGVIIINTKSKFRPDYVHTMHKKLLIDHYPVSKLNILCLLLFAELSRHVFLTMSTLMILPVKFISWWLYILEIFPLQLKFKVQKRVFPIFP